MAGSVETIKVSGDKKSRRISSFDFLKVIAAFAIVCIHTAPFDVPEFWQFGAVINQTARFAVPYFFLVSGYFYARSMDGGYSKISVCISYSTRILLIFVSWSAIYLVFPAGIDIALGDVSGAGKNIDAMFQFISQNRWHLIFEGGRIHLWFLMSLVMALLICTPFIGSRQNRMMVLLFIGGVLYGFNLLTGPYYFISPALKSEFSTRLGPLVSTLFVAIGIALYRYHGFVSLKSAWIILLLGWIGQIGETVLLYKFYGSSTAQEFIFSTIPFGLGVMLVAIKMPHIGNGSRLVMLSKYSLGIYACHMLFVGYLKELTASLPLLLGQIAYPSAVFLCAICLTYLLSRLKLMRGLVTTH
jgi:surface polysaccharide O-acyltransferase-like enzyme